MVVVVRVRREEKKAQLEGRNGLKISLTEDGGGRIKKRNRQSFCMSLPIGKTETQN